MSANISLADFVHSGVNDLARQIIFYGKRRLLPHCFVLGVVDTNTVFSLSRPWPIVRAVTLAWS